MEKPLNGSVLAPGFVEHERRGSSRRKLEGGNKLLALLARAVLTRRPHAAVEEGRAARKRARGSMARVMKRVTVLRIYLAPAASRSLARSQ